MGHEARPEAGRGVLGSSSRQQWAKLHVLVGCTLFPSSLEVLGLRTAHWAVDEVKGSLPF